MQHVYLGVIIILVCAVVAFGEEKTSMTNQWHIANIIAQGKRNKVLGYAGFNISPMD